MNQAFHIKSAAGAAELRLEPLETYHYLATLRDMGMEALARVYQLGTGDGLATFLASSVTGRFFHPLRRRPRLTRLTPVEKPRP